jgi:di/tricarboxylate transporter
MISPDIILVSGVILFLIVFLYKEWLAPTMTFFIAIVVLVLTNVITPKTALEGFANEQLATIVLLLILGQILNKSEAVDTIFKRFLKKSDTPNQFKIKMLSSVGISSAVFNNTPLVAMLMPFVYSWAKAKNQPVSRYLLPLSYASILGGCITLIGTSTNLIVSALAEENGQPALQMFDFTIVGGTMFILGILYLYFFGNKILRKRVLASKGKIPSSRKFFFETIVESDSKLINLIIQDCGLRQLDGLFLVEIVRDKKAIRPVTPTEKLQEGDHLFFAGKAKDIVNLNTKELGLTYPNSVDFLKKEKMELIELVVSHNSKFSGILIKDSNFRANFNATILAIHRNGERVWGQLGNIELRAGDVLLVIPGKAFQQRISTSNSFYSISTTKSKEAIDNNKAILLFIGMFVAVILTATNILPLFKSLLVLLLFSVFSKITNYKDIKTAIDFNLIIIIALGLALGKAIIASGTDKLITAGITPIYNHIGIVGLMAIIFIVTNGLASLITSKAAVSVAVPIVITMATNFGIDPKVFILLVAFAGAANFITPIGYQTNLMVYGPGGYSFKDFFRVGFPLTLTYLIVAVGILAITFHLY